MINDGFRSLVLVCTVERKYISVETVVIFPGRTSMVLYGSTCSYWSTICLDRARIGQPEKPNKAIMLIVNQF